MISKSNFKFCGSGPYILLQMTLVARNQINDILRVTIWVEWCSVYPFGSFGKIAILIKKFGQRSHLFLLHLKQPSIPVLSWFPVVWYLDGAKIFGPAKRRYDRIARKEFFQPWVGM